MCVCVCVCACVTVQRAAFRSDCLRGFACALRSQDRTWLAIICVCGVDVIIGRHATELEAAIAYDDAALLVRGAAVNFA